MKTPRIASLEGAISKSLEVSHSLSAVAVIFFAVFLTFIGFRSLAIIGETGGSPGEAIASSWPGLLLIGAATAFMLLVVEVLERTVRPDVEITRKLAHVGAGIIYFFVPDLFPTPWPVLVLAVGFTTVFLLSRRFGWLKSLHPPARRSLGDLLYPWSIYLLFLLSKGDPLAFRIPVLALAFSDTAASFIGQRYGRLRFRVLGGVRSMEGSLAFAATTALIILVSLAMSGHVIEASTVIAAAGVSAAGAAVEAASPSGSDNLFAPLAILFLLFLVL